jgi:Family of unknown function (DUF6527)
MRRNRAVRHEFVDFIPATLLPDVVYVSIAYATAVHACFCGCGTEVVTPLSPSRWKLTFDGETITLDPSIGNWSLLCTSHYWIRKDRVDWAPSWSRTEIAKVRRNDSADIARHLSSREAVGPIGGIRATQRTPVGLRRVWSWIADRLR